MSIETIHLPTHAGARATSDDTKLNLSSEEKAAEMQGDIAHYLEENGQGKTVNDIQQLDQTIKWMKDAFENVSHELTKIDAKDVIVSYGQPIKLAPEWRVLHDTYTSLINDSQKIARDVSSQIDSHVRAIMPLLKDPDVSVAKKEEILECSLKEFKASGLKAEEATANCSRLRQKLESSGKNIRQAIENEKTDLTKAIGEIDEKITYFQNALNTPPDLVARKRKETVLCFLASGLIDELERQVNEQKTMPDMLTSFKLARDELNLVYSDIVAILENLIELDLDSVFLEQTAKMVTIEGIWRMLVMDVNKLSASLSFSKGVAKTPRVLERKLQTMEVTSEAIKWALEEYLACLKHN